MCTRDHVWVVSRLWSAQGALIEVYSHTFDSSKEPVEVQGGIPTGLLLSSLASLPRLQTTRPTYCGRCPMFWDEAVSQDDMETEFTFGSELPTPSRQYTHFVTPEGTESHVHCCRLSDSTASFMCGESPSPSHVRAAVIYGQPSTAYLRNLVWKILLTDLKQSWRRDRGPEMVTTWRRAHVFSKDASAVSTGRENVAVCKQPAEGSGCLYCIVSLIWKRMASLGKRETDIKTREMPRPSAVLFERNKTGKGPPESPDPTTRRSAPQRKIYIVPENLENIPANSEAHPAVVAPAIIAAGPATGRPACPAERKVLRLAPFLSCANKYAASFPTKPKSPPSSRISTERHKYWADDRERDWTRRAISIQGPCSETLGNADDYRVEPVHIDEVGPCAVPGQDQFSAVSLKETRQVNPGTPSATKRSKLRTSPEVPALDLTRATRGARYQLQLLVDRSVSQDCSGHYSSDWATWALFPLLLLRPELLKTLHRHDRRLPTPSGRGYVSEGWSEKTSCSATRRAGKVIMLAEDQDTLYRPTFVSQRREFLSGNGLPAAVSDHAARKVCFGACEHSPQCAAESRRFAVGKSSTAANRRELKCRLLVSTRYSREQIFLTESPLRTDTSINTASGTTTAGDDLS
ncbi:hypothetical protein Bbelb_441640 [Branchiostoma belcheri]|nr:hypothetical protein Bbelb_441640 [Branchiostoma belcheri]